MSTKAQRPSERNALPDQRRTADRRSKARDGDGRARGRRATDLPEGRSPAATAKSAGSARKRRSTLDGREPLVVYLRPESIKALKMAALEGDTTASAIVAEATDSWLRTQGRPARR